MIPAAMNPPTIPVVHIDQRVRLHGIDWDGYEAFLALRGEQSGTRVTYLNGELELMSPSINHELLKTTLGRLLEAYAEERGIELSGYGFWSYLPLGSIIALLMVAEMGLVLGGNYYGWLESTVGQTDAGQSNVQAVGRLMFTEYVYPFELASVILLGGIVAAVALTQRGRRKNKAVSPSQQVFVKAGDRVRVLQMPAEKRD